MISKHKNPESEHRTAYAPYNFVPLPGKVVLAQDPPSQDRYQYNTGVIRCELITLSPLFIGGALDNLSFNVDGRPIIPGSSLRGMVRALVEIVGYGKVKPVAAPIVTFRAVADRKEHSIKKSYDHIMKNNVRAGYLVKEKNGWYIRPAKMPKDEGLPERGCYIPVPDTCISKDDIEGFKDFNDRHYKPGHFSVSFKWEKRTKRRGKRVWSYTYIQGIEGMKDPDAKLKPGYRRGTLISTGNMAETTETEGASKRKKHALIMEADNEVDPLRIDDGAIRDYIGGLTDFQKSEPFDVHMGCLIDGNPVFYVEEPQEDGQKKEDKRDIIYFGHCPNFRIPARRDDEKRAVTPLDFIPEKLYKMEGLDLAESIFGDTKRAGRVFFSDARCKDEGDVCLSRKPIRLKVLSCPKATYFPNYLVQDKPDNKGALKHYGDFSKTVIRGHKLYWHKGNVKLDDIKGGEGTKPKVSVEARPLKEGVRFEFEIRFESLTDVELGALLWALLIPGEDGKEYRHKIGMGKPLGMGSVKLEAELFLSSRTQRYSRLFHGDGWYLAESHAEPGKYIEAFEEYVLSHMDEKERGEAKSLKDINRIAMLLKMLEWPGPSKKVTEYMERDEYEERRVLPDPLGVEEK